MSLFICPLCGEKLNSRDRSLVCAKGHSFDRASQGYVNLLRIDKKHSQTPGDDRGMVLARRAFLESGYYMPFREKLAELAAEYCPQGGAVLDTGCGEGYYTGRLRDVLDDSVSVTGFDISKDAVRYAAGKYKAIDFAVASSFSIPVENSSVDVITNIFSPMATDEFLRVMKPGGTLIYAVPGSRHLFGLKSVLYDRPYENEVKDTQYEGFEYIDRVSVRSAVTVQSQEMIQALFGMTPYYWKTPKDGSERLSALTELETEIEFDFLVYRKI